LIEDEPRNFEAWVAGIAADHLEPARSRAYDELGDGPRAQSIATGWLRRKLSSQPQMPGVDPAALEESAAVTGN
jgi:hypothetical protein